MKNADINRLQDAIIKTKDIAFIHDFADIKGTDKVKLDKAIKDLLVKTKRSKLMSLSENELKDFILKSDKYENL